MSTLHRTTIALFAAAVVLIPASGIPALKHADGGVKWILGGTCWFGGLAAVLAAVALAAYGAGRAAVARRSAVTA